MALDAKDIKAVKSIYTKYMSLKGKHAVTVAISSGAAAWTPVNTSGDPFAEVQKVGKAHGCWQCGKKIEESATSWIADHIPPTALRRHHALAAVVMAIETARKGYKPKVHANWNEYLMKSYCVPSCWDCSRRQTSVVKRILRIRAAKAKPAAKKAKEMATLLKGFNVKLVSGGGGAHKVKVTSASTAAAWLAWQSEDLTAFQCHACGEGSPIDADATYIADHWPPQEFNTNYARTVFKAAGIKVPDCVLRPQCPACSSKQGSLQSDAKKLRDLAKKVTVVYKF
jgi:hypothetical protein